jgi:hypothetical protein
MSGPSIQRLQRRRGETTRFGGSSVFPAEVADKAVARLKLTCAAILALGVASLVLVPLTTENVGVRSNTIRPFFIIPIILVIAGAVLWLAYRDSVAALRRLDAGLALMVVVCFGAALYGHWLPYGADDVVRGPTPVPVVTLFFAVVIPVPPRRFLWAAVLAALTDPAGLLVSVAFGNPWPPTNLWLWLFAPTALGAALAVVVGRWVHALSREVAEAAEMGSYRLVEHLGAGGMGEVWLARHRMLARPAALKLIRQDVLGTNEALAQQVLTRFEREARATSLLGSPHTVEIYDFGTSVDGTFYYVMEYLDGLDLHVLVQRFGPVNPARAVHFLHQVAHSLRDAHAAGVVHRDIKPANIFAAVKGVEYDFIKVLDFGLVKFQAEVMGDDAAKLTRAGALVGTPLFMPPEVASGAEADGRSDLYALGCVGFWLLTGRHVFNGQTAVDIIVAHARDVPPSIAESATCDVPEPLERLLMQCLAKDPRDRPRSAQAVMDALSATGLVGAWTDAAAQSWWALHEPSVQPRRVAP